MKLIIILVLSSFTLMANSQKNGFDSNDIVFAGVGKTDQDIDEGIKNNISYFNVE